MYFSNVCNQISESFACFFSSLESDRGGFGMEEVKKRKAEEELEHYRQKIRAKQHNETRSLENFR